MILPMHLTCKYSKQTAYLPARCDVVNHGGNFSTALKFEESVCAAMQGRRHAVNAFGPFRQSIEYSQIAELKLSSRSLEVVHVDQDI